MSDMPYTVGKVEFSPTPTDKFYIEDEDPGICTACGLNMTPVRPGKAQCDYCELGEAYDKAQAERDKWEALAHQLAAALGHSWFNARVDHRGKLLDFLDKKKAALAAYEEATR